MSAIAVLTLAAGRHHHLLGQVEGLGRAPARPDLHVVVSMGDDALRRGDVPIGSPAWDTLIGYLPVRGTDLPLAQARNLAARTAIDAGADVLVFLDVDCIPSATLVSEYTAAVRENRLGTRRAQTMSSAGPAVFGGDISYLPSAPDGGYVMNDLDSIGTLSTARPALALGERYAESRFELFWSLSFAMSAADFTASGGFCEDYRGYGGEDTDFAWILKTKGGSLTWIGGARAYHQHHDSVMPPTQHIAAIVRNANVFYDRWGWWPMDGWLQAFATQGLAAKQGPEGRWSVVHTP
ncbi:MAG: galactosyltransferase-related protein [Ornithinimicrobium sp.]